MQFSLNTDDQQRIDICGLNTGRRRQRGRRPADSSVGYISTVNYPSLYPPDTDCRCRLTADRDDAQVIFYVLDMKLATPPGEPKCSRDWLELSTAAHAHGGGAKTKLCDWPPHVPVYTASNRVTLTFHAGMTMEARGFWIQYVGTWR